MIRKLLSVLGLCTALGFSPMSVAASSVAAVEAAAEEFRALMVDPERRRLDQLVADELTYGHSAGKLDTKETLIGDLMSGASDFVSIAISDQTVKIVGDVALVRHTLEGAIHNKGKEPGTVSLKVLQVWQHTGGDWKLLARQAITSAR